MRSSSTADITDEDEVGAAFDEIVDRLGLIGGLVNSAGIVARPAGRGDQRRAVSRNPRRQSGRLLHRAPRRRWNAWARRCRSSTWLGFGPARQSRAAAYGASKAGVKLMSEVLALEFGNRSVRVNCVAPGPIETPMVLEAA